MTNCGLNGGPLDGEGIYPAAIACNLHRGRMGHIVNGISKADRPFITHDDECRYITGIRNGTVIGFKSFRLSGTKKLIVRTRGTADGRFEVCADNICIGAVTLEPGQDWSESTASITYDGEAAIYFHYLGKGRLDFKEFELIEEI